MDLYCSDKKLSELTDPGSLGDFLDSDVFTPPVTSTMDGGFGLDSGNSAMDSDWLDNFFDDPVLNDRMISDALQPAPGQQSTGGVQSEHSYSLHGNQDDENETTLDLSKTNTSGTQQQQNTSTTDMKDFDTDLTAVNPNNMTLTTGHTTIPTTNSLRLGTTSDLYIKQEPLDLSLDTEMTTVTVTRSTNPQTLLKQPTIILATSQQQQPQTATLRQERLVLPKVEIKMENQVSASSQQQHHQHHIQQQQRYNTHSIMSSPEHSTESFDSLSLPPTPPSSTNSDSDGCDRSPPCSPHRSSRHHRPQSPLIQQPFFMSPIPTSGVLVLTEEEKRTLISEGYPIPGKLPLTKQEEKNLKKIRRKIKNKISAQESRRKKKEYLETLERKVEAYSQENTDLRKKVDSLTNTNQSIVSQLHKLQAIVRNFRPLSPGGTHTSLMVLVLCFAVMLGSWSPMSLSMGYSSSMKTPLHTAASSAASCPSSPSFSSAPTYSLSPDMLAQAVGGGGRGGHGGSDGAEHILQASTVHQGLQGVGGQEPQTKDPSTGGAYGPYATPNMRSRILLSMGEEEEVQEFGPHAPFSYKWFLGGIFGGGCAASEEHTAGQSHEPTLPRVNVMDVETEINQTGDIDVAAPSRQPDIAVTAGSKPINATS